jgi:hypothetical protein
VLTGEQIQHELDRDLDDITLQAAASRPLRVLVEHLIKWMLRLFCLLPLRGSLRLDWLIYHNDSCTWPSVPVAVLPAVRN